MKQLLVLFSLAILTACGNGGYENGVSTEGAGWWYIIPLVALVGGYFLYAHGRDEAAKGTKWIDGNGKPQHNPTPQPWYKHIAGIGGVLLMVAAVIAAIVYAATFK